MRRPRIPVPFQEFEEQKILSEIFSELVPICSLVSWLGVEIEIMDNQRRKFETDLLCSWEIEERKGIEGGEDRKSVSRSWFKTFVLEQSETLRNEMGRLLNLHKETASIAKERLHDCLEKGFPPPSIDDLKEVCLTRRPSKWEITKDEISLPPSYLLFGIANFCDGITPTFPDVVLKEASERREILLIVSEFFPKSSCLSNTFRERGAVLKKDLFSLLPIEVCVLICRYLASPPHQVQLENVLDVSDILSAILCFIERAFKIVNPHEKKIERKPLIVHTICVGVVVLVVPVIEHCREPRENGREIFFHVETF